MGVRLPLVVPSSEPFAIVLGALQGAEVDTVMGTFLTVAKLQSSRGARTKLPSIRWSGMYSVQLETLSHPSLEIRLIREMEQLMSKILTVTS